MAIYLPMSLTLPMVVGALVGHAWERRHIDEATRRIGVLMASGLIVGESLFGVIHAIPISITGLPKPLAVVGDDFSLDRGDRRVAAVRGADRAHLSPIDDARCSRSRSADRRHVARNG